MAKHVNREEILEGFEVTVRHRRTPTPLIALLIDACENPDWTGLFSARTSGLGVYVFRFSDLRTAMAFKLRWG